MGATIRSIATRGPSSKMRVHDARPGSRCRFFRLRPRKRTYGRECFVPFPFARAKPKLKPVKSRSIAQISYSPCLRISIASAFSRRSIQRTGGARDESYPSRSIASKHHEENVTCSRYTGNDRRLSIFFRDVNRCDS